MLPSIGELWDIEQIKQLKARYFRFLDTKDWTAYRTCFTDDFCSYAGDASEPIASSGDAFVALAERLFPKGGTLTVHQGQMPEIELTGERTATGIWSMSSSSGAAGTAMPPLRGGSYYFEIYEKGTDNRWRIKANRIYPQGSAMPAAPVFTTSTGT